VVTETTGDDEGRVTTETKGGVCLSTTMHRATSRGHDADGDDRCTTDAS